MRFQFLNLFILVMFVIVVVPLSGADFEQLKVQLNGLQKEYSEKVISGSESEELKKLANQIQKIQDEVNNFTTNVEDQIKPLEQIPWAKKKLDTLRNKLSDLTKNPGKLFGLSKDIIDKIKNEDKSSEDSPLKNQVIECLRNKNYQQILEICDDQSNLDVNQEIGELKSYKAMALSFLNREEEALELIAEIREEKRNAQLNEVIEGFKNTEYSKLFSELLSNAEKVDSTMQKRLDKYGKRKGILNLVNPFYHGNSISFALKKKAEKKSLKNLVNKTYIAYQKAFKAYKKSPSDSAIKKEYIASLKNYNNAKTFSKLRSTQDDRYDPEVILFNESIGLSQEEKEKSVLLSDWVEDRIKTETGSPLLNGHYVEILKDGVVAYPKRYELMEKAKESIYCAALIFNGDAGRKIAETMIEKAKQGVDSRLIVDGFFNGEESKGYFDSLHERGLNVAKYNPLKVSKILGALKRFHEKYFIVDGKYAITGGMNVGDEYANGGVTSEGWRDTDVYIEGPVVPLMVENFRENFQKINEGGTFKKKNGSTILQNDTVAGVLDPEKLYEEEKKDTSKKYNVALRFVSNKPTEKDSKIHDLYMSVIENAERDLVIANPYFAPEQDLVDAIKDAAVRGVNVYLITQDPNTQGSFGINSACRYFYKELTESGVKIYEWHKNVMHQKVMAADGVIAIIGSYNLDSISRNHNSEDVIYIMDHEKGKECLNILLDDVNESRRMDGDKSFKWNQKVKHFFSHQIDYVL